MNHKSSIPSFFASIALLLGLLNCAHERSIQQQFARYDGAYERQTLADSTLPVLMPYNRYVDPAGVQIYFGDPKLENHALDCVLSPDEKWLAVLGRYSMVIISPQDQKIVHRLRLEDHFSKENVMNVFSGIAWMAKGDTLQLFWSAVAGKKRSMVIQAEWDGKSLNILRTHPFEAQKPDAAALANEVLVRTEQGRAVLYAVLNGNNRVEKIDIESGQLLWSARVGLAPFGIASAQGKLFVTNWAGSVAGLCGCRHRRCALGCSQSRCPDRGYTRRDCLGPRPRHPERLLHEIIVGLHPNDIIASADEKYIFVANANSDLVSVIDAATAQISETISVRLWQEKNKYWGDSPNGLGLSRDGRILYVANGLDNALAVVRLGRKACSSRSGRAEPGGGFYSHWRLSWRGLRLSRQPALRGKHRSRRRAASNGDRIPAPRHSMPIACWLQSPPFLCRGQRSYQH